MTLRPYFLQPPPNLIPFHQQPSERGRVSITRGRYCQGPLCQGPLLPRAAIARMHSLFCFRTGEHFTDGVCVCVWTKCVPDDISELT